MRVYFRSLLRDQQFTRELFSSILILSILSEFTIKIKSKQWHDEVNNKSLISCWAVLNSDTSLIGLPKGSHIGLFLYDLMSWIYIRPHKRKFVWFPITNNMSVRGWEQWLYRTWQDPFQSPRWLIFYANHWLFKLCWIRIMMVFKLKHSNESFYCLRNSLRDKDNMYLDEVIILKDHLQNTWDLFRYQYTFPLSSKFYQPK